MTKENRAELKTLRQHLKSKIRECSRETARLEREAVFYQRLAQKCLTKVDRTVTGYDRQSGKIEKRIAILEGRLS